MGGQTNFGGEKYENLYHIMEDVAQLRLNECRQELLDYDKPDSISQNIASIERPSKEQVVAQHISRFPAQAHTVTTQYNIKIHYITIIKLIYISIQKYLCRHIYYYDCYVNYNSASLKPVYTPSSSGNS